MTINTIKDKDLYAIALAAEKCWLAMGEGVEADRDELFSLISTFHESIAAIINRYEYAEANHVITAGCAMENGIYLDMRNAVDEERYTKPPFVNQYSTLHVENGHVVG